MDLTWDGGKASIYLIFGQPNHATFEEGTESLQGQEALTALITRLPKQFEVEWRKSVDRTASLDCTIDDIMEPIARLAGQAAPEVPEAPPQRRAEDLEAEKTEEVDFGLYDFPLLPTGRQLWPEAPADQVHLDMLMATVNEALVVLTGPKLRAAAIIAHHQIVDAVWVDEQDKVTGETAAMAMMGAREGTMAGYELPDVRIAEALTMLWRCRAVFHDIPAGWFDPDHFFTETAASKRDCALLVEGTGRAVGLFMQGELVAAYDENNREISTTPDALLQQVKPSQGTVTVRQRSGPAVQMPDYFTPAASPAPLSTEPSEFAEKLGFDEAVPPAAPAPEPEEPEPVAEPAGEWLNPEMPADAGAVEPLTESGQPPEELWNAPTLPEAPEAPAEPLWEAQPAASGQSWLDQPAAEPDANGEPAHADESWLLEPLPQGEHESGPKFFGNEEQSGPMEPTWAPAQPAASEAWSAAESSAIAQSSTGTTTLDYNEIRNDLIQIGVLWLGDEDVAPIANLINQTKPALEDFVAVIDQIKTMTVAGHDPSVVRAMAREMHYHAAEYLCGT